MSSISTYNDTGYVIKVAHSIWVVITINIEQQCKRTVVVSIVREYVMALLMNANRRISTVTRFVYSRVRQISAEDCQVKSW
jgi:hypothetical protein